VNLRGGTDKFQYYTSLNIKSQKGILKHNDYSNYGVKANIDYRPTDKLILKFDISTSYRENVTNASLIDPFKYAVFANTYEAPFDLQGNYLPDLTFLNNNYTADTESGYVIDNFNILREMRDTRLTSTGLDATATINGVYNFSKNLKLSLLARKSMSYNMSMREINPGTYTSINDDSFNKIAFPGQTTPSIYDNGSLNEGAGKSNAWSARGQLDYILKFKNNLFVFLAAAEATSINANNFNYTSPIYLNEYRVTGVPIYYDQGLLYDKMQPAIRGLFSTRDVQDRTVSFLGSVRYSYLDKYVLNLNARSDGADIIGSMNRFTPLWSIGAKYNIHKENFFRNNSFINELALSVSYGYTGNIDRTAYPFSTIGISDNLYQGNPVATDIGFPNPSVKWEHKRDFNIGLDLALLQSKFLLGLNYYSNRIDNVLTDIIAVPSTGATRVKANGGILENKGYEANLRIRWVQSNDITFITSVNLGVNKNRILESLNRSYSSIWEAASSSPLKGGVYNILGEETGMIYGWKFAGVNPDNGNPRYFLTERGKEEYKKFLESWDTMNANDREIYSKVITDFNTIPDYVDFVNEIGVAPSYLNQSIQPLGRRNPKIVGGFGTVFRFKNFEFITQWTFKAGHIIQKFNDYQNAPLNIANPDWVSIGYSSDFYVSQTNRERKYLNYWQGYGDETEISRFVRVGADKWKGYVADNKYESGDFLRMTYVSVSYRVPSKIVQRVLPVNNVTFSLTMSNPLTLTRYTGIDVATSSPFGYPVSKDINFRLSFNF